MEKKKYNKALVCSTAEPMIVEQTKFKLLLRFEMWLSKSIVFNFVWGANE